MRTKLLRCREDVTVHLVYPSTLEVRISEEVEHRFRPKWNIDSGKWNTDFEMWNIHSGGSGTAVPES